MTKPINADTLLDAFRGSVLTYVGVIGDKGEKV